MNKNKEIQLKGIVLILAFIILILLFLVIREYWLALLSLLAGLLKTGKDINAILKAFKKNDVDPGSSINLDAGEGNTFNGPVSFNQKNQDKRH